MPRDPSNAPSVDGLPSARVDHRLPATVVDARSFLDDYCSRDELRDLVHPGFSWAER